MAKRKEVKKKEENQPTLENVENEIITKVVQTLSPELNKAVEQKFEDMKTVLMNEIKDIRKHFEQPQEVVQEVTESEAQPVSVTNLPQDMTPQQEQAKAGLESILPLIQMISGGNSNSNSGGGGGGLSNMFMEAVMRKSLADITRGDMMNEVMMKAMYRKLLGEDLPDGISKTTDKLMSPLREFGDKESSNK